MPYKMAPPDTICCAVCITPQAPRPQPKVDPQRTCCRCGIDLHSGCCVATHSDPGAGLVHLPYGTHGGPGTRLGFTSFHWALSKIFGDSALQHCTGAAEAHGNGYVFLHPQGYITYVTGQTRSVKDRGGGEKNFRFEKFEIKNSSPYSSHFGNRPIGISSTQLDPNPVRAKRPSLFSQRGISLLVGMYTNERTNA